MKDAKGYTIAEVPLTRICYDYRDDIAYRIYVMMTEDWVSMKLWKRLKHGKKAKKLGSYKPKYLFALLNLVKETPVKNTKFAWKGVKKQGHILDNVHFAFDKKTGIYYPAGGGSRVAIAYFLCHSHVPGLLVSTKEGGAWKKSHGIGSKHFNGMPDDIIKKMLFRREINNLFVDGIIRGKIGKEFLYKIPDLGFRGECDRNDLLNDKTFLDKVKGKKILNLIQDNGYLEVGLSEHCSSIMTVGDSIYKIKISKKIAEYYKKYNIDHEKNIPVEVSYDVVLYRHGVNPEYVGSKDRTIFDNGKVFLERLT